MQDRTFDRVPRFDERSRKYPITAVLRSGAVPLKPRSYTWGCPVWLDQGSEGACTGFAVTHEAAARPVMVSGVSNELAIEVYHRAQYFDEWTGEDYEGSSVLGAIKAGKERGWYGEYRWAFGVNDLALAVGHQGPAVLGVNWYEGMMQPSAGGLIRPDGKLAGGHAILCIGYNHRMGMFKLHNSWGIKWGDRGECFISYKDMDRLLKEQGEACIPVRRHYGK